MRALARPQRGSTHVTTRWTTPTRWTRSNSATWEDALLTSPEPSNPRLRPASYRPTVACVNTWGVWPRGIMPST
eukprot:4625307-Prymnesium_polylepis.1